MVFYLLFLLFLFGNFLNVGLLLQYFPFWNMYIQPVPLECSFHLNLNEKMILYELEEFLRVIFSSCL